MELKDCCKNRSNWIETYFFYYEDYDYYKILIIGWRCAICGEEWETYN